MMMIKWLKKNHVPVTLIYAVAGYHQQGLKTGWLKNILVIWFWCVFVIFNFYF